MITLRSASVPAGSSANQTSWPVAAPAGVADGDLLLLVMGGNNAIAAGAATQPGWTVVPNVDAGFGGVGVEAWLIAYYRIANGEPASYTLAVGLAGGPIAASIYAYEGVNTAFPINASAITGADNSGPATAPSVATSIDGCLVIDLSCIRSTAQNAITPAAGFTERGENFASSSGGNPFRTVEVADRTQATAGATGTAIPTSAQTIVRWTSATIALTPHVGPVAIAVPPPGTPMPVRPSGTTRIVGPAVANVQAIRPPVGEVR